MLTPYLSTSQAWKAAISVFDADQPQNLFALLVGDLKCCTCGFQKCDRTLDLIKTRVYKSSKYLGIFLLSSHRTQAKSKIKNCFMTCRKRSLLFFKTGWPAIATAASGHARSVFAGYILNKRFDECHSLLD